MNIRFNKNAQSGFTLIELIVVIVILGILAATALPKFSGLSGDARVASLQAARGALSSTSAMLHGRSLITPNKTAFIVEGNISVPMSNGYPTAGTVLATAAGLDGDYTAAMNGTALRIKPKNIPDTMTNCFIEYSGAASAGDAPAIRTPEGMSCE